MSHAALGTIANDANAHIAVRLKAYKHHGESSRVVHSLIKFLPVIFTHEENKVIRHDITDVASGHQSVKTLTVTRPVLVNPNGFASVAKYLDK